METKLPNFLVVGAAKSGTTSLYHYLQQHPEIYMSPVKEPRFITAQFIKFPLMGIGDAEREKKIIKTFDEYRKLFSNVTKEKAIGEASADSLYFYTDAVKCIKNYLGDIKIVIILRNPTDRTFSNYLMLVKAMRENLSFEDALKAEEERKRLNWAYAWHYKSVSLYYNQLKAYMENFSQIKICLYDDLLTKPSDMMKDLYAFLNVDASFIPDMNFKYNVGGKPKNKFVQNLLITSRRFKIITDNIFKFLKIDVRMNKFIKTLQVKNLEKQQMRPETREYLKRLFKDDILKLQNLINRDLSHWLE